MKTLAKLLLLVTLTLSSSAFAMKTIDLVDKAQMTDQQKMDLAQKLAEKQDWKAVFEIMYPLALEGNLQAQSNLGMLYNLGRGVDENKELAYWWFSEAAQRGSIKAINNLAVMYFNGNNYVKQNTAQAIKLFEASATKDPDAMLTLGEIYTNQKEFTKAFEWFQKAANAGSNEGRFRLARLYEEGIGTQVNIGLAKLLYLEIMNTAKKDEIKEIARQRLQRLSLY